MEKTSVKTRRAAAPEGSLTEKIGFREKFFYGGGDLASNLVLVLTSTFATFFYTDALGLNASIIGMILLVSRLLDGVSDILMGYIMDKTRSRHGKARPWMLWLAIPIAISTVLVFVVPNMGDVGKYIYIAITYNLVTTILYTAINIPYGALTARLSRDQNQRMIINVFRMFMAQIGSLAINALTLPFVKAMGGAAGTSSQSAWVIVSCVYGVLAALLFLLCFYNTKERVDVPSENIGFLKSLKLCLKNDQWLLLVAVWVVLVLGLATSMSVGTYYAKYVLGDESYFGFLSAAGILVALVVMPVMTVFIKKYGKRNVALLGAVISLVGQAMALIDPASFNWLMLCSVIKGVGSATAMGTMFAMIADTIEYGQWKTGIRVEGMLYSTTTFGAKVGAGVGGAVAMAALGAAGYNGLLAVQNESAMQAIKTIYLIVPLPFLALMPLIYLLYKLDKIYPKVMADLSAGRTMGS
ncbi:MAG: glycoside-pentoside-hexuronide (GPH):cation symporter [Eubacteriales bacterium]|nr:glycoside-pentoside-hexuronide (GPH):cation symporter [Eubacteriales bacterium]